MADVLRKARQAALSDSPEVGPGPHDPRGLALAARGILVRTTLAVIMHSLPSSVPTLVVVGSDDRAFLGPTDYMAAKIPGARRVLIPDCGHAPNIDNPSRLQRRGDDIPDSR